MRNLWLSEASESPAQASQLVSRRVRTSSEVALILFAREEMVPGDPKEGSSEKAAFSGKVWCLLITKLELVSIFLH